MSTFADDNHSIRNRKIRVDPRGPPVPHKPYASSIALKSRHGLSAPTSDREAESKPLPPVPKSHARGATSTPLRSKPLPSPPKISIIGPTFLWIVALCVWFMLIIVLLPVITEKDAMPGFNRWLRTLWE